MHQCVRCCCYSNGLLIKDFVFYGLQVPGHELFVEECCVCGLLEFDRVSSRWLKLLGIGLTEVLSDKFCRCRKWGSSWFSYVNVSSMSKSAILSGSGLVCHSSFSLCVLFVGLGTRDVGWCSMLP